MVRKLDLPPSQNQETKQTELQQQFYLSLPLRKTVKEEGLGYTSKGMEGPPPSEPLREGLTKGIVSFAQDLFTLVSCELDPRLR